MKLIVLFLTMILAGCATQMPQPIPCEIRVKGECRDMTAGEKTGAIVRGHSEEVKDTK